MERFPKREIDLGSRFQGEALKKAVGKVRRYLSARYGKPEITRQDWKDGYNEIASPYRFESAIYSLHEQSAAVVLRLDSYVEEGQRKLNNPSVIVIARDEKIAESLIEEIVTNAESDKVKI